MRYDPTMQYARLGNTGLKVSRICLGCMSYGTPEWRARQDNYSHEMYRQPEDWDVADRVAAVAARRGVKPAQIALAWLLHQPGVTAPIVGATRMEHLEDAVAALDIPLDETERRELEEAYRPHPVLGHE
jgi:1-deoxyxylulose-5-phosphate synthase